MPAVCNDVGLILEAYDPHKQRMLGNFPQELTHIGLIDAAYKLFMPNGPVYQRSSPTHRTG